MLAMRHKRSAAEPVFFERERGNREKKAEVKPEDVNEREQETADRSQHPL
eukprot:SAG31_NODE_190_length_20810_cov_20.296364_22_plen_50_part_00